MPSPFEAETPVLAALINNTLGRDCQLATSPNQKGSAMRIVFPLLAAVLLATPVAVQAATTKPTPAHLSMQQRFEQANVTHDGHLTLDQAKAGYKSIVRHFTAIDHDNKGYITEDDIRAYYKTLRASHHQPAPTPPSAPTPAHSG
jgi:hypothetical protein